MHQNRCSALGANTSRLERAREKGPGRPSVSGAPARVAATTLPPQLMLRTRSRAGEWWLRESGARAPERRGRRRREGGRGSACSRQPRGRAFATEHVRIRASQWISRLSSPPALSLPLAPLAPAALQHAFRRGWRAAEQIPRPSERGTAVPERRQTGIGDLRRGTRREGWTVGRVGAKLSDTSVPPVGHNLQTGPQFLSIVRSSLSLARTLCRAFARSLRSACAPPPPHSFAHSCIWRLAYRVISSRYPPPSFPFHSRASTLSLSHALLHHERRRRKF